MSAHINFSTFFIVEALRGKIWDFSAILVTMLIKVGGDQYESLETKKLVGQFSGLHIGPQWPRPLPYMVREAQDFKIPNFTLL